MSWIETTLGPHIDIISGPAFKSQYFTNDSSDIPLVKGENIGQGMILWDKSKFWPRGDADGYFKYRLQPDDVVLAMDRPWVPAGLKYAVISERDPEALLVQRVARIRGINGLSCRFLRYVIGSPKFSGYIKNIMGGTNVPHISANQIRAFRFTLPPMKNQDRIASILSAYDDLIENNRRHIALLERAAQLLYREWFVRLRFPGHEQVRIEDGVPEGWKPTNLPDVIDVNPQAPVEKGKEIWYVPMSALSETGMTANTADFERRVKHTNVKFRKNDVLLARITPCLENGKTGFAYFLDDDEVACGSTEFIVLRSRKVSPTFVYCLARSYPFRENAIKSMIGSSGRQRVQVSSFDEYKVLLPPKHLIELYDETVSNNFEQIKVLMEQNYRLNQARNLLLPRLMNEEVVT